MSLGRRRLILAGALAGAALLGTGCSESETTGGGGSGAGTPESCDTEGAVEACYDGPESTRNLGECQDGSRSCEGGLWGECLGSVPPTEELCDDLLDNDCNGVEDEGCPCVLGETRPCYDGPESVHNIGICVDGTRHCEDEVWAEECVGQGLPLETELCNQQDDTCDGVTDEGCICTPAGSYCAADGSFIPCPAGTYQPAPAQASCIDSGVGNYVPAPGATAPTPCPAGGYYCPASANTAPTVCPAGSYTNTGGGAGASACGPCPSGDYCTGDGDSDTCSDGMGSPPGSTNSGKCGCNMRLTICEADCSNFPSGCAYGSTQWMEGAKPNESYCIQDTDWGHGRQSVDCDY